MRAVPAALVLAAVTAAPARAGTWPHLARFVEAFVSPDGRVIERSHDDRTTSEGQAYVLFFALVANDRPLFDRLLSWTAANLARGSLARHLPAWHWGRAPDGSWRVLDGSAASDADLWIGYTLLEAARLWRHPPFAKLGRALLAHVVRREVARLEGLGPMLLPGPVGFVLERDRRWRLNPSYLPLPLLRRLAHLRVPGPWGDLPATTVRMIRESAPHGYAPDWLVWDVAGGFQPDPVGGPIGSYDAIRVYLWAALTPADEPLRAALLEALSGPLRGWRQRGDVYEKVNVLSAADAGATSPPGFLAVVAALATAAGDSDVAGDAAAALEVYLNDGLYRVAEAPPRYYDQVLTLFARGFLEGRFRFDREGALRTPWGE